MAMTILQAMPAAVNRFDWPKFIENATRAMIIDGIAKKIVQLLNDLRKSIGLSLVLFSSDFPGCSFIAISTGSSYCI
jgi:hypothetical protein